jgi:hypothetical protein
MKQPEIYKDGWLIATPQQKELQKPVVKAFKLRQYNNTINNMRVITGAERKDKPLGKV